MPTPSLTNSRTSRAGVGLWVAARGGGPAALVTLGLGLGAEVGWARLPANHSLCLDFNSGPITVPWEDVEGWRVPGSRVALVPDTCHAGLCAPLTRVTPTTTDGERAMTVPVLMGR